MRKTGSNEKTVTCGVPLPSSQHIKLGHGSGGTMSAMLLDSVFMPRLAGQAANSLEDAAIAPFCSGSIVVTNDAFVVKPIFFPGGNIGSLAVHGTINDLACRGARPLYLSVSFVLEEGLAISELNQIVDSMAEACAKAGVRVIAGDTKVVNKGAGDKVYISATGIGELVTASPPSVTRATVGDAIIVSGDIGRHGMAVMCARNNIDIENLLDSDSAPLFDMVSALIADVDVHAIRDITRGGLSSVLNEIARSSQVGIQIAEPEVPVHPSVRSACELLGLDPLYVACEGRMVFFVREQDCNAALAILRSTQPGAAAQKIGTVTAENAGSVIMKTMIGGHRRVDLLSGEQLPRIC